MNFTIKRTGIGFNGRPLFWSNQNGKTKLCLHCGNPNHQIKDCTLKRHAPIKKVVSDEWQRNYDRFKPAGHKRSNSRNASRSRSQPRFLNQENSISYANAANTTQSQQNNSLDESIHSPLNHFNNNSGSQSNNSRSHNS